MLGIISFGGYIPPRRLQRSTIVAANAWANRALMAYKSGARAICNWDEDSITMGVAAARDCLYGQSRDSVSALYLASTTLPFLDRQNASVVAEALNLRSDIGTLDITASQRAATSGLINAVHMAASADQGDILFIAADQRRTRSGAVQELLFGDGAAALRLGVGDDVKACFLGGHSITVDFVDHYRGQNSGFDYEWEERWIRDEGYMKIVPHAVEGVLRKTEINAAEIDHFILPSQFPRLPAVLAKRLGIRSEAVVDTLYEVCGNTGAAHPMVMLVHVLEHATPGQKILVTGFGQGCDALLFEVTNNITDRRTNVGIGGFLARGLREDNYNKYLTESGLIEKEFGKRAEADQQTALSAFYRNRAMLTGFVGGCCETCGTIQFPKSVYCVNPQCNGMNTQRDNPMADTSARVVTWTADYLTFTIDPPAYYGLVQFEGGGRLMVDFTEVDKATLVVGSVVRMDFRIKNIDQQRDFRRYFWKAVQVTAMQDTEVSHNE